MSELVSVIVPTYNRASLIGPAIESVINQTYTHWELIIVDDGSSDNTAEVVAGYQKGESRIVYYSQENAGSGAARNTGIRLAKGDYITFLDSDDVFLENKILRQLELIRQDSNVKVVVCQMREMKEGKLNAIRIPLKQKDLMHGLLSGAPGAYSQTPLLFIDAKFLKEKEIYFDVRLPTMDDVDFLVSIAKYSNYDIVNEILFESRLHGGNHINSENNILAARLILLNKYSAFYDSHPGVKKKWIKLSVKKYLYFDLIKNKDKLLDALPSQFQYHFIKIVIQHTPKSFLLRRIICNVFL